MGGLVAVATGAALPLPLATTSPHKAGPVCSPKGDPEAGMDDTVEHKGDAEGCMVEHKRDGCAGVRRVNDYFARA